MYAKQFSQLLTVGVQLLPRLATCAPFDVVESTPASDSHASLPPPTGPGFGPDDWIPCGPGAEHMCLKGRDAESTPASDSDASLRPYTVEPVFDSTGHTNTPGCTFYCGSPDGLLCSQICHIESDAEPTPASGSEVSLPPPTIEPVPEPTASPDESVYCGGYDAFGRCLYDIRDCDACLADGPCDPACSFSTAYNKREDSPPGLSVDKRSPLPSPPQLHSCDPNTGCLGQRQAPPTLPKPPRLPPNLRPPYLGPSPDHGTEPEPLRDGPPPSLRRTDGEIAYPPYVDPPCTNPGVWCDDDDFYPDRRSLSSHMQRSRELETRPEPAGLEKRKGGGGGGGASGAGASSAGSSGGSSGGSSAGSSGSGISAGGKGGGSVGSSGGSRGSGSSLGAGMIGGAAGGLAGGYVGSQLGDDGHHYASAASSLPAQDFVAMAVVLAVSLWVGFL